jgi:hypothetical protein
MRNSKTWLIGAVAVLAGVSLLAPPMVSAGVAGTLVPGGKKESSDCYVELNALGFEGLSPDRIQTSKKGSTVTCTDGESCDQGPCGDDRCDIAMFVCLNQTDPNLASCTAPSGLDKLKLKAKGKNKGLIDITVPQALEGPFCFGIGGSSSSVAGAFGLGSSADGAFVLELPAGQLNKKNKLKGGSIVIAGSAKAVKGTKPRKDPDKFTFQCLPRTVECPSSPSGAFLD